jgi:hypothetical protein
MTYKIILTLIAVGLLWNALNPWIAPTRAIADDPIRVEIVGVDKYAFDRVQPIEVKISK